MIYLILSSLLTTQLHSVGVAMLIMSEKLDSKLLKNRKIE